MLLARLCNTVGLTRDTRTQRRHSWGSEFDYHYPEFPPDETDSQDGHEHFSDNEVSSDKNDIPLEFDLIAVCHNVTTLKSANEDYTEKPEQNNFDSSNFSNTMGQTSSLNSSKPKLSLTWVLRNNTIPKNIVLSPEPPIKFQYSKTRRKNVNTSQNDIVLKQEDIKNAKVKPILNGDRTESNFIRRNSSKISKKQIKEKLAAVNAYYDETFNKKLRGKSTDSNKIINSLSENNNNILHNIKSIDTFYEADYITAKQVGDPKTITRDNKSGMKYISSTKDSEYDQKLKTSDIYNNKTVQANINYNNVSTLNTKAVTASPRMLDNTFLLKKRTSSEPTLVHSDTRHRIRVRHKRRSRSRIDHPKISRFGYDIEDIDSFLTKASLKKPANIPVVLSYRSMLYQTQYDDYQDEIPLPLGMVVNAVFKKESWLYVQTPHGEEGYISYSACLPLGIIPQDEDSTSPCWETSTDLFPRPCGNMTDSEKLTQSECSTSKCKRKIRRTTASVCGERSVDRLYLRAAANSQERDVKRQTLLVIDTDYAGRRKNTINVSAGDVVALISANIKGWFWIRTRDGSEGFIPASIAGHGYL